MDEKILNLLTEMNKDLKSLKTDVNELKSMKSDVNELMSIKSDVKELKSLKLDMKEFKTEMHNRFDKFEAKLVGVGGQFELTNESRMDEFDFIAYKVNKLEKEIFLLKSKNNN